MFARLLIQLSFPVKLYSYLKWYKIKYFARYACGCKIGVIRERFCSILRLQLQNRGSVLLPLDGRCTLYIYIRSL